MSPAEYGGSSDVLIILDTERGALHVVEAGQPQQRVKSFASGQLPHCATILS